MSFIHLSVQIQKTNKRNFPWPETLECTFIMTILQTDSCNSSTWTPHPWRLASEWQVSKNLTLICSKISIHRPRKKRLNLIKLIYLRAKDHKKVWIKLKASKLMKNHNMILITFWGLRIILWIITLTHHIRISKIRGLKLLLGLSITIKRASNYCFLIMI
jgi:hypothetical protein